MTLRLALATAIILGCAPLKDDGAEVVSTFFGDLAAHRFDAAADLVRDDAGVPIPAATRAQFIAGWRKAYEGYHIEFNRIALTRVGAVPSERLGRAGAVEGYAYDVRFFGVSDSPCVPVNSNVIPGTTQPIALRMAGGGWFLLADGLVGFIHTCPGA